MDILPFRRAINGRSRVFKRLARLILEAGEYETFERSDPSSSVEHRGKAENVIESIGYLRIDIGRGSLIGQSFLASQGYEP